MHWDIRKRNALIIVIASCQILAVVNTLIVVWVNGSTMSLPMAAKLSPYLLFGAVLTTYGGLRETWSGYQRKDWPFIAKGIGLLLMAGALWDTWNIYDRIGVRDIVLLIFAAIAPIPLLYSRIMHKGKKCQEPLS